MKVLGITGGLGSGKSTICRIFSVLGIPVYEADAEVKHMYSVNDNLAALLAKNFPAELFDQGRPDTRKFATYFFGRPVITVTDFFCNESSMRYALVEIR